MLQVGEGCRAPCPHDGSKVEKRHSSRKHVCPVRADVKLASRPVCASKLEPFFFSSGRTLNYLFHRTPRAHLSSLFREQAQLENARRDGVPPNLINYNACVDVCAKTGEVDRALALLEQMKMSGDPALTPDLVT